MFTVRVLTEDCEVDSSTEFSEDHPNLANRFYENTIVNYRNGYHVPHGVVTLQLIHNEDVVHESRLEPDCWCPDFDPYRAASHQPDCYFHPDNQKD